MKEELPPPETLEASKKQGHELRDVNVGRTVLYGLGMLVLVVLAGAILSTIAYKSMAWMTGRAPAPPQYQASQDELPPAPRLEVRGSRNLKEFREAEEKQLESYGWVNRERNIVRIPITRAMDLVAERGAGN